MILLVKILDLLWDPGGDCFFFPDSLVTARAQLQPAHPNGRACDITEDHDIHELFVLVLIHCNILWDTYISWLRYSTLKIPLDTFDLWRLVSLDLKRLQPVLRATSRAGKCSNQVGWGFPVVSVGFSAGKCGMFFQAIQDDPTWFKMGVQHACPGSFGTDFCEQRWELKGFFFLTVAGCALELWNSTGRIWFDERSWGGSWLIIVDALT